MDIMSVSSGQSQASEALQKSVREDAKGYRILSIKEGKYKGWIPRVIYSLKLDEVYLPFLQLQSFPVGGTSLGSLNGMKIFHCVGNYLFKLSNGFGNCKEMQTLNLSFNHFIQLPPSVFKLHALTELNCSHNELESLSSDIGQLVNLKNLNLAGNLLKDVPEELSCCKQLQKLNISRKWYPRDGGFKELPPPACNLPNLTELDVSWHQIHTIPDDVGTLVGLQRLNMKGNYLRYVSKEIKQCTKLQFLDLTGAMRLNSVIPVEIFFLSELRDLNISGNYFTELSPEISGLEKLENFKMCRNALLRLPNEIFHLEFLESMVLCDNLLEEIPENIKYMQCLKKLTVSGNKLKTLPDGLCQCFNLRELDCAQNILEKIPQDIYHLSNLRILNLAENKLKELPMLLDKLTGLQETGLLVVYNNYLEKPPQEICDLGVKDLFQYLKEMRVSEAKHRRKMILIGSAKAGKTSLRNALVLGHSKMTAEHERTWVLERHLWEPLPSLRVQMLDFGGHHIYSVAHHLFLTPEALHLVVFDLSKYSSENYEVLVGDWIDAIADRAPGAHIVLVGTHEDLCTDDQMRRMCSQILKRIHDEENNKINDLKIAIERIVTELLNMTGRENSSQFEDIEIQRMHDKKKYLQRLLNMRVVLPDRICVVSCTENLFGIEDLRKFLITTLKQNEDKILPKSWSKYLLKIQKKEDKILLWDQALSIYSEVMANLNQQPMIQEGSEERSLDMILRYLHATGEIVWYHDNPKLRNIIFHRPETLVEMLRAIFRHDFAEVVQYNQSYGQLAGISAHKFDEIKEGFLRQGVMTIELLHFCLLHFQLKADARDMFIDLMLKFDLCYEIPKSINNPITINSARILKFPWFLDIGAPEILDRVWPTDIPRNEFQFTFQLQFVRRLPPNFFEKLSSRVQGYIFDRHDWKDGILAHRNSSKILLTRSVLDGSIVVTTSVRGTELQELWFLIVKTYTEIMILLSEWPFVRYEQWLLCTHCLLTRAEDPYRYPGEILMTKCPKGVYEFCSCKKAPDVPIPACFICPLDEDFQDDLARHVKVASDFHLSLQDQVDALPMDLLSDLGLRHVAANLGVEWSLVASYLGIAQQEIEQIQVASPYNLVNQSATALLRWRGRHKLTQEAAIDTLLESLKCAERKDLVDDLIEKYHLDYDD